MKALTFNTNSWHFRLVTKMTNYNPFYDDSDICAYSKAFFVALLWLAVIGTLIGMVGYLLAHALIGVVFSIIMGAWFFTMIGEIIMLLAGLLIVAAACVAAGFYLTEQVGAVKRRMADAEDNFVKSAYQSWKGKYCVKINFKD